MLGNSLKSEFKFRAASKIQMSPDVVCFLIADAVFNGFVYFRILSCERTLRRKFGIQFAKLLFGYPDDNTSTFFAGKRQYDNFCFMGNHFKKDPPPHFE